MAIYLDHQAVYTRRQTPVIPFHAQLAAAVLLLFALGFKVWVKVCMTDVGYRIAEERLHLVELDREQRELKLKLAVLLRHDNLRNEAVSRLGLAELDAEQIWKTRE
jgi:hypothetical protein